MSNILPSVILNFSEEAYKRRFGSNNPLLYNGIIIFIIATIFSMFYIKVPVTVQNNGLIKSQAEKTPLFAPTQGKIIFINMKENLAVKQGDLFFLC